MGETADDLISGRACSWCGVYFEEEHGYPVLCDSCFKKALKEGYTKEGLLKKLGLQKSSIKEIKADQ
jgi:hypothetical protein